MKISKQMKKQFKEKPVTMTQAEITKLKSQATDHALKVILGFSLLALRDEWGFSKKRLLRFHKKFFEITEAYNENYLSVDDIWQTLEKETGLAFGEESEE